MLMICPERNCPRRAGCMSANPHEENPFCREGCTLQDAYGKEVWSDNRKPCVVWRGDAYAKGAYQDAVKEAKEKRRR